MIYTLYSLFLLWTLFFSTTYAADSLLLPDVTNKTVVLSLAELAANAYHSSDTKNTTAWRNTTGLWNFEYSYGWDIDGLRGHVFSHIEKEIIVVSVKGTTLSSAKDKESANMICSCNCCYANCTRECDKDRLLEGLPNMYLSLLLLEYGELLREFPNHAIWFTGHSMGAVIASLAGVRTCNPAIAFSSPGEQLFANRIGLEHKCNSDVIPPIYHIGYYKDPIYTGSCGWICMIAGYRMDSRCHHGYECTYDYSTGKDPDEPNEPPGDGPGGLIIQERGFPSMHRNLRIQKDYGMLGGGMIYTHTINFFIDKVITPSETVPICLKASNCTEKCISS